MSDRSPVQLHRHGAVQLEPVQTRSEAPAFQPRTDLIQEIQRQAGGPLPAPVLAERLQMKTGQPVTAADLAFGPVQASSHVQLSAQERAQHIHTAAARGISGSATALPFLQQIQTSFGRHDVSGVQAFVDGAAREANLAMGAEAYATGTSVAFKGAPDLHTTAHEAAHIIQQRGGVQLKDGIGESGDCYERHADAVADLVVQGKSAEALLDEHAGSSAVQAKSGEVQHKPDVQLEEGKKGGSGGGKVLAKGIVMKRKNIHLTGDDKYGHWWTELNGSESYGWWPKYPVGLTETLLGCEGELNGQTSFGGTATLDPHHGDAAEESFTATIDDPTKTEATAIAECKTFATGYSGEWRWTFGFGQNCHTFQEQMMKTVGLSRT